MAMKDGVYIFENTYEQQFFEWAGLTVVEVENGCAVVHLHVQPHHRGGGGTAAVNGGIAAYMFDGVLGAAVRSTWTKDVEGQVTMTLNIQYLRPLIADDVVIARGRVTHRGRGTAYVSGEIYDREGQVSMMATGIFHLFRRHDS